MLICAYKSWGHEKHCKLNKGGWEETGYEGWGKGRREMKQIRVCLFLKPCCLFFICASLLHF